MIERRTYRKVYQRLWRNREFLALNDFDRMLTIYAMCGPQSNRVGLFRFSVGTAADDLRREPAEITAGLSRICNAFAWVYDTVALVLWIPSWWEYNPVDNPKHLQGCLSDLSVVPRTELARRFCENVESIPDWMRPAISACFGALDAPRSAGNGGDPPAQERYQIPTTDAIGDRIGYTRQDKTRLTGDVRDATAYGIGDGSATVEQHQPAKPESRQEEKREKGRNRPVFPFRGQSARFELWQWQWDRLSSIIGDPVGFNLPAWLASVSDAESGVVDFSPKDLLDRYLIPRLREEIRRRGLPSAKAVVSLPASVASQPTDCRHNPRCQDAAECGRKQRDAEKVWEPKPNDAPDWRATRRVIGAPDVR